MAGLRLLHQVQPLMKRKDLLAREGPDVHGSADAGRIGLNEAVIVLSRRSKNSPNLLLSSLGRVLRLNLTRPSLEIRSRAMRGPLGPAVLAVQGLGVAAGTGVPARAATRVITTRRIDQCRFMSLSAGNADPGSISCAVSALARAGLNARSVAPWIRSA